MSKRPTPQPVVPATNDQEATAAQAGLEKGLFFTQSITPPNHSAHSTSKNNSSSSLKRRSHTKTPST